MITLRRNFSAVMVIWLGLIVLLVDRYTKHLVITNLEFAQAWNPFPGLLPYFRIVSWSNTGAAFGTFQGGNNIFILLAIVVCGAVIFYSLRVPLDDLSLRMALGLQLGGALGNLFDRILYGHAVEFISFLAFPVFNVADLCISIGVMTVIFDVWREDRGQRSSSIVNE